MAGPRMEARNQKVLLANIDNRRALRDIVNLVGALNSLAMLFISSYIAKQSLETSLVFIRLGLCFCDFFVVLFGGLCFKCPVLNLGSGYCFRRSVVSLHVNANNGVCPSTQVNLIKTYNVAT